MQIENHKEEVPFAHYEELFCKLNAEEAAQRTGAKWDGKEFYVNLLGREFAISHPVYGIRALDGGAIPPLPTFGSSLWGAGWLAGAGGLAEPKS